MAKQTVMKLYHNNTFDKKKMKIEEGRIHDGDSKITFMPLCKFTENKPRLRFWRSPESLVFFVDGAVNALQFGKATKNLQLTWSKKEANAHVKKQVAIEAGQAKPLKMWQFGVIIIILLAILFLNIYVISRTGRGFF